MLSLLLLEKITVTITKNAEDNVINEIINCVHDATLTNTKYTRIADQVAGYFVPLVMLVAIITYFITYIF